MMHCLVGLALVCSFVTVFSEDCKPGTCKSDETCCPTAIPGDYSCCPFENAVCCVDHTYCCPQGTECDIITGSCRTQSRKEDNLQSLDKLEKRRGGLGEEAFSNDCKPGTCDFDETCCPTAIPGDYSCCPYSNAVCCEDHTFCCPEDTECDIIKGTCIPKGTTVGNKLEKRQGLLDEEGNFKKRCGDGSLCAFDNTCCKVDGDKYGCCPHLYATCCPDGIHCCPHDEKCDITSHYCVGKRTVHDSAVKEPALPIDFEDSA
ncbi:Granulins [Araneus ventricosus]|uniref:Granulins n=1 Tax=Araneus ventricosus TaxID=182803 RepID=A0A4Y2CVT4_ARAVE|nr:Granulins [Araneus ventricosus]